jgi:methyl-accepting chemotaxis protein
VIGVIGIRALGATSDATQRMYDSNIASVRAIGELQTAVVQTRVDLANHAITADVPTMARYEAAVGTDIQEVKDGLAAYRASHPAGNPDTIDAVAKAWDDYATVVRQRMLPAGSRNDLAAWQHIRDTQALPILTPMHTALIELAEAEDADAARAAADARSGYRSNRTVAIVLLVAGFLAALGLGLLVARRIVAALERVREVCAALAAGDLTRTAGITNRDEVGQTARSLDEAMQQLREVIITIEGSATSMAGASEQMSGVSNQIASSAEEASVQAQAVSAAAEQVSRSVQTVSAASEEMSTSIQEIARNANDAAQVATQAVELAHGTNETVGKLGESSQEIGNVIKTITSIAEQTNLLALNATIEAARAGEAGKGFAVVATEVKELAQETARATEDIARRVQTIQSDAGGALTAIDEISGVIAQISDFQTTIASAVEEQTATTGETSRSVTEAADGVRDIAGNITGVAEAARLTSQSVTESQQTSEELARMSHELSALVGRFTY